jgi:hypothetical protein
MTPNELDQFLVKHTSQISGTAPALFLAQPDRERHFGSGVLLQVEETRFPITAAHVADDCFERYKLPCFGTSNFDELILVNWGRYCRSKKQEDPNREDDPIDVAVLELTQEVADKLSTFMRFLTLDDLELDPDKLNDGLFLVNGFPDFRAEKDEMDQTIVAGNLPYMSGLFDIESFSVPNLSPKDHIALEVSLSSDAGGLDLDKAQGISGCGMWRLLDEGQPIEALDWRKAKLVPIVTDRSDPDLAAPVQYLRGTKIKHAIRMIYHGWDYLKPIIRAAIPTQFVAH